MNNIVSSWNTQCCWVRDSLPGDASELTTLYNSCSALAAVDPSFGIVEARVAGHPKETEKPSLILACPIRFAQ